MMGKIWQLYVFIGIYVLIVPVNAWPIGAPTDACYHMSPLHDEPAQASPPPFEIIMGNHTLLRGENETVSSYEPGDNIYVTIHPLAFKQVKGFLLMARRADYTKDQNEILGTFTPVSEEDTQVLNCGDKPGTAVTHKSTSEKHRVHFVWTTPVAVGHVEFIATIVVEKHLYWMGIKSHVLEDRTAPAIPPPPAPSTTGEISLEGCESTKGCFRIPHGCTPEAQCDSVITWTDNGTQIDFEISTKEGDWVCIGFSHDMKMGDDSVMKCVHDQRNSVVSVSTGWNEGKNPQPVGAADAGLYNQQGSFKDGRVRCTWTRDKKVDNKRVYNLNDTYHLMTARGPASGKQIQKHSAVHVSKGMVDLAQHTFGEYVEGGTVVITRPKGVTVNVQKSPFDNGKTVDTPQNTVVNGGLPGNHEHQVEQSTSGGNPLIKAHCKIGYWLPLVVYTIIINMFT